MKSSNGVKKALVTGVTGQDGAYLAKLLLAKGYKVFGMVRSKARTDFSNTDYLDITKKINFVSGDLTNEKSLEKIIKQIRPDEVYNLAAQSFVGSSWQDSKKTTETNALGVLSLLTALKTYVPRVKFYQASTSEMFGDSSEKGLQTENTPFKPKSPYAISKLYGYWITNNFRESYGMFCCNGILFNHESPLRGTEFVTRKITSGVAKIKLGLAKEIRLGNLSSRRDWGFAGDYVEAMWRMLQQQKPDDYIISTGQTHSIKDFLDVAFKHADLGNWKKYVVVDSKFKRPVELLSLHGKSTKAKKKLGWVPKVKFKQLVEMMVDADIKRLSK